MYITNNRSKQNKHSKYNISDFPANYSGQYTEASVKRSINDVIEIDLDEFDAKSENHPNSNTDDGKKAVSHIEPHQEHHEHHEHHDKRNEHKHEKHEEKKDHSHSLIGNLLHGKDKKGGGGGLLSSLFNKKDGDGGILSSIDIEDLILLAVIFFLLKDGIEDDFLIILALILFA